MNPVWHGSAHGWLVDESKITKDTVVFDIGVGTDTTWIESLHEKFGCQIYSFDPTPGSIKYVEGKALPWLKFFPVGIWIENCSRPFHPHQNRGYITHSLSNSGSWSTPPDCTVVLATLKTLMDMAGVDHVDILKVCLGGDAEYPVVSSMLLQGILPEQVLVLTLHLKDDDRESLRAMLRGNGYERMILPGNEPCRESYVR